MAVAAAAKYPSIEIDSGEHTPLAEDEVVFPLLARDTHAIATIECYRELCIAGDSPPEHIAAIDQSIEDMAAWQKANPELVNTPD